MPSLSYLFTVTTFYVATSFILSIALAIVGLEQMRSKRPQTAIGLMVLAGVVAVAGVLSAARQDQTNEVLQKDVAAIKNIVAPEQKQVDLTPQSILGLLQAQRSLIINQTKNNFPYFRLFDDERQPDGGPYKLHLVSSPGPVFTVAYWISPAIAQRNAKDPRYWSVDHPKPLIPVIQPNSEEWTYDLPAGDFIVEIDALTGHWNEYLTLSATDGRVKQSIKVINTQGEVFYDTEALAPFRN